jgi:internalin A
LTNIAAVANMTKLTVLDLSQNDIVDISALQGLTLLSNLSLSFNAVTDLTPLVKNAGLATGDSVNLINLSGVSCTDVTTLRNRGAQVFNACP